MTARALRVIEPGLATTVQDSGRIGYRRYGVPTAGALDSVAWRLANALAGAPEGAAALELRLGGPTLAVEADALRIAYVGAAARLRILRAADGEERVIEAGPVLWPGLALARGDRLSVERMTGAIGYLAVDGGVAVAPVLGSRSTALKGGFGGWQGRTLRAGDVIPLGAPEASATGDRGLRHDFGRADGPAVLRAVPGPQDSCFTEAALAQFFEGEWRVSAAADRMGLRLDGPLLEHRDGHDIVSDGIPGGAVQVPGDGKPILLLADRGTTGGYPKIACVATVDLPRAGRLLPGARLRFERISPAAAVAALRAEERGVRAAIAAIGPFRAPGAVDLVRLYEENLVTARAPDEGER